MESGKVKKEKWKEAIKDKAIPDNDGDLYITKSQLAYILDSSVGKINYAIEKDKLNATKMGEDGSKSEVRIYVTDAEAYIDSFK